jgi:hypothetical protein
MKIPAVEHLPPKTPTSPLQNSGVLLSISLFLKERQKITNINSCKLFLYSELPRAERVAPHSIIGNDFSSWYGQFERSGWLLFSGPPRSVDRENRRILWKPFI